MTGKTKNSSLQFRSPLLPFFSSRCTVHSSQTGLLTLKKKNSRGSWQGGRPQPSRWWGTALPPSKMRGRGAARPRGDLPFELLVAPSVPAFSEGLFNPSLNSALTASHLGHTLSGWGVGTVDPCQLMARKKTSWGQCSPYTPWSPAGNKTKQHKQNKIKNS